MAGLNTFFSSKVQTLSKFTSAKVINVILFAPLLCKSYAKGDVIATDCNVTGNDIGTPTKPKYALKNLWEHILIPALDRLLAPGGRCAGAMDGGPPRGQRGPT
jgi:hypothetical protein